MLCQIGSRDPDVLQSDCSFDQLFNVPNAHLLPILFFCLYKTLFKKKSACGVGEDTDVD